MRRLLIFSCALLLAGCASRTYRFDGVGADGSRGREIRYVLASDDGNEGSITLEARGRAYDRLGERETDTLRVTIVLDNASDDDIEVPIDGLALTDDEGRTWHRVQVIGMGDAPAPSPLVAPAQARTSYQLLYDAGAPGSLRTTGSVILGWSYRFRGQTTGHESRFLPVRIERRTYWSSGFFYGDGGYRGGLYWGPAWGW